MRKRERDLATETARRRLELLQAELTGLSSSGDADRSRPVALDEPEEVQAGPPAGLRSGSDVLYAARGRPLPPRPAAVGPPGRHAVPRRGGVPDWVDDRVPTSLRGRLPLTGQHLTLLAGVLAVVLLVTGWVTVHRSHQDAVPAARFTPSRPSGTIQPSVGASVGGASVVGAAAKATGTASPGPGSGTVVVDVAGKVRRPGVVTLPSGSRVQDAIAHAGGARPGARTDTLNLARVLVDGEQILVGVPGAVASPAAGSGGTDASGGDGPLVNINTAGESQLEDLPGVGPVTAQKILAWRTAHGAFTAVNELLEVDGIGDKTLADIAPHATL